MFCVVTVILGGGSGVRGRTSREEETEPRRIGIFHGSALLEDALRAQRPSTLGKVVFLKYSIRFLAALSRQNRRFVRRSIFFRGRSRLNGEREWRGRHGFCIMHSLLC